MRDWTLKSHLPWRRKPAPETARSSGSATSHTIKAVISILSQASKIVSILWLFTKDDFDTFILPNSIFGAIAALAEARSTQRQIEPTTATFHILSHIPHTILFNWANLLIFDLANQRLPASVEEDRLNKPWRPLPRALITPRTVTHVMLAAMPAILAGSYVAGIATETALLFILTWMYNDLRGGDEHWALRNGIIATAFFLYNIGSAKIAGGALFPPGTSTLRWASVISAIILTTMQVQDFKDQEGDAVRGRVTIPLALGDGIARWTFAVAVALWSVGCIVGARAAAWYALLILGLGSVVAYRSVCLRGRSRDRHTWKLWCLWCASIYGIPLTGQVWS